MEFQMWAVFAFILVGWLLMTRLLYRFDLSDIPGGRDMIEKEIHKLGPVSRAKRWLRPSSSAQRFCGSYRASFPAFRVLAIISAGSDR